MKEEGYRLPERTKEMLFDMVPTIGFVIVFIVIFFAPEGGTFYQRLEKFDGLIAGALAIFAAFITVRAMRKTDIGQEKRHRTEMALLVRTDNAKIERLVEIAPIRLRRVCDMVSQLKMHPANDTEPLWVASNCQVLGGALFNAKGVALFLQNPIIVDCEVLFDPVVTNRLDDCRQWAETALATIPQQDQIVQLFRQCDAEPDWFHPATMVCLAELSRSSSELAASFESWGKRMLVHSLAGEG